MNYPNLDIHGNIFKTFNYTFLTKYELHFINAFIQVHLFLQISTVR